MVKVTIIIVSWNRKKELKKCLDNVSKQNYKDYEVIIIDNHSSDGTKEMLMKKFPKFNTIYLKENVGAAKGRNIGINASKGELLWFLDSDAYPINKTCLKKMVEIMDRNPKIGELGGEIIDGKKIRLPIPSRNQDGYFIYVNKCRMKEVDSINTSNSITRKELIKKIKGFDPEYFYGFEDIEVSYKILKLGYKIVIDDRVLAFHEQAKKGRVSTLYIWQRNRIRFIILKENLPYIIFLPLTDIITLFKLIPKKIEALKKIDIISFKKKEGLLINGIIFLQALVKGYLWNIKNFNKTREIRRDKPDFLKNEIFIQREL